ACGAAECRDRAAGVHGTRLSRLRGRAHATLAHAVRAPDAGRPRGACLVSRAAAAAVRLCRRAVARAAGGRVAHAPRLAGALAVLRRAWAGRARARGEAADDPAAGAARAGPLRGHRDRTRDGGGSIGAPRLLHGFLKIDSVTELSCRLRK